MKKLCLIILCSIGVLYFTNCGNKKDVQVESTNNERIVDSDTIISNIYQEIVDSVYSETNEEISNGVIYNKPKPIQEKRLCDWHVLHYLENDKYDWHKKDEYEYWVTSSNEYEDHVITFSLGIGKETAICSLKTLIRMYEDGNDTDEVTIGDKTYTIHKEKYLHCFGRVETYSAGGYYIDIKDLKKYVRELEKYTP